jgi:V/A-type H+-transporting ATPase subunit I
VIVPMLKLEVLGPRPLLAEALAFLQAEGALALRAPPAGVAGVPLEGGAAERRARLSSARARAEELLAQLPPPAGIPLPLPPPGDPAFAAALEAAEAERTVRGERRAALLAERQRLLHLAAVLGALAPLQAETPVPPGARAFGLALRREREEALPLLEAEVGRLTGGAALVRAAPAGEGELAVLLLVPASAAARGGALLFERGVEELRVPEGLGVAGPGRTLVALWRRAAAIPAEVEEVERAAAAHAGRLAAALARARRAAAADLQRLEAEARCGETARTFVVCGWAPAASVPLLAQRAQAAFAGRVAVAAFPVAPGEEDDVPVVLRHPRLVAPFRLLLGLVPLPRYGSVDPTPWLAVWYPLLFGFMLGDLGFGALAAGAALLARRRGWGGAFGRDVAAVALACALSAAIFGVLYGELFGSLGEAIGLHPLLLDRRDALVALLAAALGAGLLHLAAGLALGAFDEARRGALRHAAGRAARLVLLLAAAAAVAAALAGADGALRPALAVAGAALAGAVAAEGAGALLEAVLGLGHVLSYARLMALGLASVMLAEVANGMPAALPGAGGLALALGLHAVNFTLGAVSPAIAALRLQLVEFLEKFYREGGQPWRPLALA